VINSPDLSPINGDLAGSPDPENALLAATAESLPAPGDPM